MLILYSSGELLWASILVKRDKEYARRHAAAPTLAVRVHALEEEEKEEAGSGGSRKMRWVERDDRSLGDRVLFLGSPASFAADAAELGLDGGCAYFVFNGHVRYCFVEGETKPVEWMPPGQSSREKARLWLRPAPTILEIQDRHETPNGK
jgi:hypothetical protein